ncbi:hypothetical protein [Dermatobacter hominis]|uniref:hypothetical protein n=1 Tax=Dermatobacter hominis TaxID=2884263 RepID=UPI001D117434|nr:hypothetical protein [Dermatobacter hominis]UDY34737.1 hypothetical protein LH044_15515 [Dermatobacter hominis]
MVTRREFLAGGTAIAGAGVLAACAPPATGPGGPPPGCAVPSIGAPGPLIAPGSAGLVDEAAWQARAAEYLQFATGQLGASSPSSIALHQLRASRDAGFTWDPSAVTVDSLQAAWTQLDTWADTGDFTLMYLHWVHALDARAGATGGPRIDPAVIEAIELRMREFRYRYDDPLPADRLDHKWFWSENHRLIFAVDELLSGLAQPDATFTVTGLTGAQHAARARPVILEWIRERGRYGFSEWHSNVYLPLDINPLLTVIELSPADDVELQRAASGALDLCLVDLAAHLHRGVYGATRGRTYEKDKMTARDENTFTLANLLFSDTTLADGTPVGFVSASDASCLGFIATDRYRLPEVVRRMAISDEVGTVLERHGLPLDPTAPVTPWPEPVDGHGFDESELEFWWAQGAMTSWQLLPATLAVADRYRLWDTSLFRPYRSMRILSENPAAAQLLARELAPVTAAGLLGEPHTVTWRSPDVMLSTVVDHRVGHAMEQSHAWQATLDADAFVFTTHPTAVPGVDGRGEDSGYWTGTASMPRSAQHEQVSIHCYWPGYEPLDLGSLGFTIDYEPYTHAFFPQERFDAVVQQGGWTFGRRGDGFVALWSHLPTEWRTTPVISSATFDQPFDLVATGDPRNVWVCEVARAADWGPSTEAAFDAFVAAIAAAPVSASMGSGGWEVSFDSPSAGPLRFGSQGDLTVDGVAVALHGGPRHRSRWGEVCHLQGSIELFDPDSGHRLAVDTATGARETS